MPDYTATIQLTDDVVRSLDKSKYNLALVKEVVDGSGEATINTIFTTRKVVPKTSITWGVEYALNWASELPAKGAQVVISGHWKKCVPGQALTLVDGGLWENNEEDTKEGYLTVRNHFDDVNILVG